MVVGLVFQGSKALTYGLVCHRRYPQSLHRTLCLRHLHDPPLDELSLLSGVTTVDDAVGSLHETLYDSELFLYATVVDEFYAEARRNHRQRTEAPPFPVLSVVVGLFQGA